MDDVAQLAETQRPHTELLTPRVAELISELTAAGRPVYLLSGGFRQLISQRCPGLPPLRTHRRNRPLPGQPDPTVTMRQAS